jgi:hypothetical protein
MISGNLESEDSFRTRNAIFRTALFQSRHSAPSLANSHETEQQSLLIDPITMKVVDMDKVRWILPKPIEYGAGGNS